MTPDRDKAARELLAFYQEAGVDALLGETPIDRFAAPPAIAAPAPPVQATAVDRAKPAAAPPRREILARDLECAGARTSVVVFPDAAVAVARRRPHRGESDELRAILEGFDGCALKATATRLVFADGNPQARVMFVGEAPGRDEDLEGLPFIGRSGKLLDLMMAAVGLDRKSAYIANIIPWRPPGNRDPSPQETAICLPFIRRQIELANPDVLVCLGKPSAVTLLDIKEGITKARGRWFIYHTGTRDIRATVTLHPAYLLRQPLSKRLVWRDFLAIKKALATA
jgi:DNA polymerase